MISINRNKVSAPKSLVGRNSVGGKETSDVIAHFNVVRKRYVPYKKYKAYNMPDVKTALCKLFHNKCAYCESYVTDVYYGDVEHFRPKARIDAWKSKNSAILPGYYRLASDWNNLLFSCKICNSINTQTLSDGSILMIGKGNYFPLRGRKGHDTNASTISREESYRLLINPCLDKPSTYFRFDEKTGNILVAAMRPLDISRAEVSIEIYGLHRYELCKQRLKLIKRVQNLILTIEEAISDFDNAILKADKERFQARMDRGLRELKELCMPTSEYSAVAKQLFDEFKRKYR